MDDDLDFSNDALLRQLQSYKEQIEIRLTECRDGLQLTVDEISHIEQKREIGKLKIEKEFEKTKLQILYILNKRKKKLLKELDNQINIQRDNLLKRVNIYQQIILQANDLKPEILKLEKYELNNNKHIITSSSSSSLSSSNHHSHHQKFQFNHFINSIKKKHHTKHHKQPQSKPPPVPVSNYNSNFMSVPDASLHNLPIQILKNNSNHLNDNDDNKDDNNNNNIKDGNQYIPSPNSKKRLLLELATYFFESPPAPHKPTVSFICSRKKFINDIRTKFNKYGNIESTTGSSLMDIQYSINSGVKYIENGVTSIVSFGSMIANGFKKKEHISELKTIPPPLLIIYLSPEIEKCIAEQFGETISIITNESGCIISIINYNNKLEIQKWLDPQSISATKISNNCNINDYAYNPTVASIDDDLSSSRSILRVCILLYSGEKHKSKIINDLVNEYENKYNLRNICGVEMKKVSNKPPTNISNDCPNCYVGCIFYDNNDGIVPGQETIFDSIAKCVFSPNNEFEDDENENININTFNTANKNKYTQKI